MKIINHLLNALFGVIGTIMGLVAVSILFAIISPAIISKGPMERATSICVVGISFITVLFMAFFLVSQAGGKTEKMSLKNESPDHDRENAGGR